MKNFFELFFRTPISLSRSSNRFDFVEVKIQTNVAKKNKLRHQQRREEMWREEKKSSSCWDRIQAIFMSVCEQYWLFFTFEICLIKMWIIKVFYLTIKLLWWGIGVILISLHNFETLLKSLRNGYEKFEITRARVPKFSIDFMYFNHKNTFN